MTDQEKLFLSIGKKITQAEQSQMFGKPCFKINGKAFICFFQKEMVFKLTAEAREEALSLEGSQLFDPSGKKRPMKEWVQISSKNADKWEKFAEEAMKYVVALT
jgi:hypothetical protein